MASVTYHDVVKKFGDVTAVNEMNFEVADKEFLVLVGPSGCGKTTALRLLAGLEEITSGDISIGDRIVNDVAPKDRDIAMVFQSYALYPHLSVFDNLAFGLKLRKTPKAEIKERVNEAAQILGIKDLLERKPRQLSGGQRQRVAVGRAIVREPKVFLFDEPLSNLDAKLRVQMRAEISKLHQKLQTTFVYVTHDQVEAMTMATRISLQSLKSNGPGAWPHVYTGSQGQGGNDNLCFRQQAADCSIGLFFEPLSIIRVLKQHQRARRCFGLQPVQSKLQLIRPAAGHSDFFHTIGHGADYRFHVQQVTEKTFCSGDSAPGCQIL